MHAIRVQVGHPGPLSHQPRPRTIRHHVVLGLGRDQWKHRGWRAPYLLGHNGLKSLDILSGERCRTFAVHHVCVPGSDSAAPSHLAFSRVRMSCAPSLSSPGRSRWALGRNGRGNSMPGPAGPRPQAPTPNPQPLAPKMGGKPAAELSPAGLLQLGSSLVFTEQLRCLQ